MVTLSWYQKVTLNHFLQAISPDMLLLSTVKNEFRDGILSIESILKTLTDRAQGPYHEILA